MLCLSIAASCVIGRLLSDHSSESFGLFLFFLSELRSRLWSLNESVLASAATAQGSAVVSTCFRMQAEAYALGVVLDDMQFIDELVLAFLVVPARGICVSACRFTLGEHRE